MRVLGIVGGIGPESTVDYYKLIVARYRALVSDGSYPRLFINSLDLSLPLGWFTEGRPDLVADYLVGAIEELARAGADFALMAANSAHVVFAEVSQRSPLPLVSIAEAARAQSEAQGLKRLGLLGTKFTMDAAFFPEEFAKAGIGLVVPSTKERDWIHEKYIGELLVGDFRDETREGLLGIVGSLVDREGIDGVLLAGTELPLTLRRDEHAGVPFLDTTQIHVESAVQEMLRAKR